MYTLKGRHKIYQQLYRVIGIKLGTKRDFRHLLKGNDHELCNIVSFEVNFINIGSS